jgi:Asp-tRNA(Asn)/Glu-tRNA(Gln) amidotransferase B subunit
MTPAEYEWQCELAETEIRRLMREHSDKVIQARDRPQLIGWFVGQALKNLGSKNKDGRDLMERLANELIMMPDRV